MRRKPPHDDAPDVHAFFGNPDSTFDVINQFGTYNIQPTADTDDLFPLIAPGLPRPWRSLRLDKHDLEQL